MVFTSIEKIDKCELCNNKAEYVCFKKFFGGFTLEIICNKCRLKKVNKNEC